MSADWVDIIATLLLGIVGLYLANSLGRQVRVTRQTKAVEKRFEIYDELWKPMEVAAPMSRHTGGTVLPEHQRKPLYRALTRWFFEGGGGMVLGEPARTIYLRAKENLGAEDLDHLYPDEVRVCVQAAEDSLEARRRMAVRQFSLLRTAMRAELGIFGRVYGPELRPTDEAFLRSCGAQLWRRPWWRTDGPWWRDDWRGRVAAWRRRWDREDPRREPDPCAPESPVAPTAGTPG